MTKKTTKLDPRQEAFAKAYATPSSASYGNATGAAIQAGYKKSSASKTASGLRKNPAVMERLAELYAENRIETDEVLSNLRHDRLKALEKKDISSAVRCDELLGKRLNLFADKHFISTDHIRQLTEKEQKEAKALAILRVAQIAKEQNAPKQLTVEEEVERLDDEYGKENQGDKH